MFLDIVWVLVSRFPSCYSRFSLSILFGSQLRVMPVGLYFCPLFPVSAALRESHATSTTNLTWSLILKTPRVKTFASQPIASYRSSTVRIDWLDDLSCCIICWNEWAASWQNQQNDCAPIEDSDQPGHPPCLIRGFAVRMKKPGVLS